eukprot:CAMPEP_0202340126 /NCGR_PEP_ID=MMETSP1126-20121109/1698_1 /ASSEMBLY_ACC=CAM_ASM_000457 /TAXON_ID=3047 /ORGANISM="Dunaliella tertiolecta, Strain CCMP1320" /LENGTH=354 /DNA_ID=CAMNT_0048930785 /DNA_START=72 /DNA_END=1133 /DNA_ORIENTATION=+
MAPDHSVSYSLKLQSRALAAVQAEKNASQWVVGTNSLREENEVHVLEYDHDQERIACTRSLLHKPEVWDIATSCQQSDVLITVWGEAGNYGASLWRIPQTDGPLEKLADLPGHQTNSAIRRALWHPQQPELAITIEDGMLHRWAISDQGAQLVGQAPAGELLQLWSGALQPQQDQICATAGGNGFQLWDLRSMACTGEQVAAHKMPVRDVSFCPSSSHRLVSGGDDCKLRLWDLRMLGSHGPLLELGGHSHWVWRAQVSPMHDQLIASSSSDCLVNLFHTPEIAKDNAKDTLEQPSSRAHDLEHPDGKVHTYDEHEDSVYGLCWSAVDPWLFATLSYDGRLVLNSVPKNVKYKI